MSSMSDLVRDSRLDTRFQAGYTVHVYNESDPNSCHRAVLREEHWVRVKCIGKGGHGNVWLESCARGKHETGVRAVKVIGLPQLSLGPVDYHRELEAIAKFSHPKYERCFVKSFGWYDRAGEMSIAMEYFPLGDLQSYLFAAPALPESEAQQITFQILEGVSFMHTNGFAHRDLKPANILIRSQPPESWWVKIGDFGISKRAAESSTLVGTPGFIAPELYALGHEGKEPIRINSYAADMWSMGCIIFLMLTKNSADVQNIPSFPLSLLGAHSISASAQDFIQCLMNFAPQNRLTVQQALLHKWMKPFRFPSPRSSSSGLIRHPVPVEGLASLTGDVFAEPSASWSTSSDNALQRGLANTITTKDSTQRLSLTIRPNATITTADGNIPSTTIPEYNILNSARAKNHAISALAEKSHGRMGTSAQEFQTSRHPKFRIPTPSAYSALSATTREWLISSEQKRQFDVLFDQLDVYGLGYINGEQGVLTFGDMGVNEDILGQIWELADIDKRGKLDRDQFAIAMYLIRQQKRLGRHAPPATLPPGLVPPKMRIQSVSS